jgi:flagellar biogenesis protein FliO
MNRVAQHTHANSQSRRQRRGCVLAFERLPLSVSAGLLAAAAMQFTMSTADAQQEGRRTTSRSTSATTTTSDPELTEISNPRLRAHFQSNNVLQSRPAATASESEKRGSSTSHDRAERQATWASPSRSAPASAALRETPSASPIQRASYEQTVDASTRSTGSLTTNDDAASETAAHVTPTEAQETTQEQNAEAPAIASATSPAPAFLDLSGEGNSSKKGSGKAIGEHGAELSIETSPQHVLYRAVAWIVIALCMFSLAALGVRKWQRQRGLLPVSNGSSRVLETLSLGPGRAVSLIEMSGYRALVAFDTGGIKQLVLAPRSFDEELNLNEEPEEIVKASQ